ncbi:MAG TPA: outer membrane protein assembly factor BamB [Methylophilaceae bacterium]|nr:outer membrane protein assembly factor BamB [Methylophilaceae bacterium]
MLNRKLIRSCLLASVLLLAGCSFLTELRLDMADRLFGREPPNPPAELKEITPTLSVKLNWSTQVGKTARYDYSPAVEAGAVYAANAEGELAKWDIESGRQIWRVNAEEAISGGVGVGGGLVMVGTNRGHVIAYDFSGKLVWKAQLSSEILSAPQYADSLVIVRSGDNHLYGLDAIDGSTKWVYERKVPALSLRSAAGFVVDGGAVYAGFSGGKMAAVRADNGKLLWEATVAIPKGVTEIERIADITSLPVVFGPVVYAVAYQGRIAAIDRLTGKVLWNREISSYSGIAHDDTKIYVSHVLGSVYSLNDDTGRTYWRQGDLSNRRLTTPLVLKDYVAVGDLEGYIHFLDIENGQFAARIKIDDEAVMSMVKGESPLKLVAATRGGGLYSVSIGNKSIPKATPLPKPKSQVESIQDEAEAEITTDADEDESEGQRSILFEQDSVFSPAPRESSGPGITLPRAQ